MKNFLNFTGSSLYLSCRHHRDPFTPTAPRSKDGNGSGSDRVESPCTQNQNPKSKPEPETIRVEIHHQNQTRGYPKPADKYTHIHMYKQEATNNKYFHESTLNKFHNLSKHIVINIL